MKDSKVKQQKAPKTAPKKTKAKGNQKAKTGEPAKMKKAVQLELFDLAAVGQKTAKTVKKVKKPAPLAAPAPKVAEKAPQSPQTAPMRKEAPHTAPAPQNAQNGPNMAQKAQNAPQNAKKQPEKETFDQYAKRKEKVAAAEERNTQFLIFFRSNDPKWWKMGWRSVLFYRYMVGPGIKAENLSVSSDRDFGLKSPQGIKSFRADSMERYAERMIKYGLEEVESSNPEKLRIFRLRKPLSMEEITALKKAEELKFERLNTICPVVVAMPELDTRLADLAKRIKTATNKWKERERVAMGNELLRASVKAMAIYREAAWGFGAPEKLLMDIRKLLGFLLSRVDAMTRVDYFDLDTALILQGKTVEIVTLVDARLGKRANGRVEAPGRAMGAPGRVGAR